MHIKNDGFIGMGIGTGISKPSSTLHLFGQATRLTIESTVGSDATMVLDAPDAFLDTYLAWYADGLQKFALWRDRADDNLHFVNTEFSASNKLVTITSAGDVGVGMATPLARLHVTASGIAWDDHLILEGSDQTANSKWNVLVDSGVDNHLAFRNRGTGEVPITLKANGKVGIGTTTPAELLHVNGSLGVGALIVTPFSSALTDIPGSTFGTQIIGPPSFHIVMDIPANDTDDGFYVRVPTNPSTSSIPDKTAFSVKATGNVGINTSNPSAALDVVGTTELNGNVDINSHLTVHNGNLDVTSPTNPGIFITSTAANASQWALFSLGTDRVGSFEIQQILPGGDNIPFTIEPGAPTNTLRLESNGHTVTTVLEITGGADLAEPFEMTAKEVISEGSIVVIDPENPGQLKLSTKAYDTCVAGIVSGAGGINTGLTLRQEGMLEHGQNVALSGRVYAKVSTINGSITPGDMLTTSSIPGHAMKATDRNLAYGTVIGKAMSALEAGEGLVLVLVNLL